MMELGRLVSLALDELDEAEASAVEEHVLSCGDCATKLERLLRIGAAVREVVRSGQMMFPCSPALLAEMRSQGLISRTYHVAPNQVVPCAVGADDIYAATTLEADLRSVEHLDLVITTPALAIRMQDIPFDATQGLATYLSRSDQLRTLPDTRVKIELLSMAPSGESKVGEYFLQHTGYSPAPPR